MAILLCPGCGTRYEIQAVFPPEGRKARCYKCGEVWLATPVPAPAESASAAAPAPDERGGTFARLDRPGASPIAPPAPVPPAGMANAAMTDAIMGAEATMDEAFLRDAEMGSARWKSLAVAIGWLMLALVVAS